MARAFKALGDPTRVKLLSVIAAADDGEACVCDLLASVSLSQPTVSHHLKILVDAGLLSRDQRGKWAAPAWTRTPWPESASRLRPVLGGRTEISEPMPRKREPDPARFQTCGAGSAPSCDPDRAAQALGLLLLTTLEFIIASNTTCRSTPLTGHFRGGAYGAGSPDWPARRLGRHPAVVPVSRCDQ